ncbi:probable inactive DNA (cytosine-5)-methyltransferase DRM3 isoform X1 [Cajanus cajan]|uniref:probable inactive DNA (cytosine-5)-methyltransferase DRM3 isoform X1 n=2 Tax=Cajanus cajan TaxID=3821 RepID=UPI0010FAEA19|nr:probable inactive DNA (cytosine-5)-methyltransferase DRM3 isoform X1 [Cajanus cajan]
MGVTESVEMARDGTHFQFALLIVTLLRACVSYCLEKKNPNLASLRSGKMAGDTNRREGKTVMVPKTEDLDYELPPYTTFSGDVGLNVASSSGGKLRAFFIGMGFLPCLVDKVIEENGEENSETLLEALLRYSANKSNCDSFDSLGGSHNTNRGTSAPNFYPGGHSKEALQNSNSLSSDSLDSLFDDKDPPEISNVNQAKEEPDELSGVIDDRRGSLLMMNFSAEEVDFAIHKLGNEASIPELVDFIFAVQIAKKLKKEPDDITYYAKGNEVSNEKLFGIMAKTLQLFEMGFSENEVSSAIDKLGPEAPISELANFIFAEQNGIDYVMEYKFPTTSAYSVGIKDEPEMDLYGTAEVKPENFSHEPSQSYQVNLEETYNDNRVKEEECIDEFPSTVSDQYMDFVENDRGKRPKYEHDDSISCLDPCWVEERVDAVVAEISKRPKPNPSRCLSSVAAKPPFFLFGNVSNISYDSWSKMSQFLYGIEPEFVNAQLFSALDRIEGYIHNLPVENRFHILPKPPMTIEDAIPRTKKWWPPWDSRKQLSNIYCETSGIAQTCDRLGNILADSGGVLTSGLQKDIHRYCRGLNLLWIGKYKLGPVEPEQLELILGYPVNHTRAAEGNLTERLKSLKYSFQTDTLGYHLSVLKPIFPHGLTMLSLFSGLGGAEIALHRLDIKIKAVVSIETSDAKRKILDRWWRHSGQSGTLVQIEDAQKLTSKKLESLISKFGGFDLVIYQNPCSYSGSKLQAGGGLSALDFSVFCECVRVLQRVRAMCQRK